MSAAGAGLAGLRWADSELNPNPSVTTTKANAIDDPRTFLFNIESFSICLFDVNTHYMTLRKSDALAARHGWPVFASSDFPHSLCRKADNQPQSDSTLAPQSCGAQVSNLRYTRSTNIAMPIPPLIHSVANPRLDLRFFISCNKVVVMRTPVQPIGCPNAIAPPLTFKASSSKCRSRSQAITWAANASLISTTSMSPSERFCLPSMARTHRTG